jgi:hypothetical protein
MMLGPGSRVTIVEKNPRVSTLTETPLTETIASVPVRPRTIEPPDGPRFTAYVQGEVKDISKDQKAD